MTPLIWILLGELLLVSLSVSTFYFMTLRKRRKRLLEAMDSLLQQFQQAEPVRLQQLQIQLETTYRVKGDSLTRLSQKLLAEEKSFIRSLLQALITRDTAALAHLHEFLQRLMDTQIKTIADALQSVATADKPSEIGILETEMSASAPEYRDTEDEESLPPLIDPNAGDIPLLVDEAAELPTTASGAFSEEAPTDSAAPRLRQDELLPPLTLSNDEDVDFPQALAPSAMDEPEAPVLLETRDFPEELPGELAVTHQTDEDALAFGEYQASPSPEAPITEAQLEHPGYDEDLAQTGSEGTDETRTIVGQIVHEVESAPEETEPNSAAGRIEDDPGVPETELGERVPSPQNDEMLAESAEETEKPARKSRKRSAPRAKQKKDPQPTDEADEQR